MFTIMYPATFKRDEAGRVMVEFSQFPGARTDGADRREASDEAMDCLGSVVAFAISDRAEIPRPAAPKRGQTLVPVPFWIAGKLALYWAMREQGVNQSQLARKLNVRETIVRRMLDPNHDVRPERLQEALTALGRRLVLSYDLAA